MLNKFVDFKNSTMLLGEHRHNNDKEQGYMSTPSVGGVITET